MTAKGQDCWVWCQDQDAVGRVVQRESIWGCDLCRVWLPHQDRVVTVAEGRLQPVEEARIRSEAHVGFASAAARISEALQQDTLLAPLEASVIPLPHQLLVLQQALSGDRVRYLLADEVGLGKTIEAGLILRELKARGLVRRTLVVSPAGLVGQWVTEMRTRFREKFHAVEPGNFQTWRKLASLGDDENLWRQHAQVVCPMDSVKPVDSRKGWDAERRERHNRERFVDLVTAGWDLVIVDEAHRLAGSTDTVARYRLGDALSQASPYLLLLTATPHQGKTESFRRLVRLLDAQALPNPERVLREDVAPYVIRTEKRTAIDADGNLLFKPRRTQLIPVAWSDERLEQRTLYEAVTHYVRHGYDQAKRQKHNAMGFLMILMQRLVSSSTAAIRNALERRLDMLALPSGQQNLFPEMNEGDWAALDGQEQLETLLDRRLVGLKDERKEVESLLSCARRCAALGPDTKAEALLQWIRRLQAEEGDPRLKVLIFTEFVATQDMLVAFLEERGYRCGRLNGSMDMAQREEVQKAFAGDCQVLVSTDAGGEGLNLQFCHVVVNYDLPWNPMRLEQRIGRVDRIGQAHVVRALNLALQESVEYRVREVLEEKLARILEEFGVDKLSDVLDTEDEIDFDPLYVQAVLDPEQAARKAQDMADEIRQRCREAREAARLLVRQGTLDPAVARGYQDHLIGAWTQRMVTCRLELDAGQGSGMEQVDGGWRVRFPDGSVVPRVVFAARDAVSPGAMLLATEDSRVRGMLSRIPLFAPGQPVPRIVVSGIPDRVSGLWSLWRVGLHASGGGLSRYLAVFLDDSGVERNPTARQLWERLSLPGTRCRFLPQMAEGEAAGAAYEQCRGAAERQGSLVFDEIRKRHEDGLNRERRNAEQTFQARRRSIERLGLAQVRGHRLEQVAREEHEVRRRLSERERTTPELSAVVILRICPACEELL